MDLSWTHWLLLMPFFLLFYPVLPVSPVVSPILPEDLTTGDTGSAR